MSASLSGEAGRRAVRPRGTARIARGSVEKIASVPFIFIMVIEFGSKGADIKGLLGDS